MTLNSYSLSPVVIDIGSEYIKAGFAGYDTPQIVTKAATSQRLLSSDHFIAGNDALQLAMSPQPEIQLTYPLSNSIIQCFDGLETLIRHTINELKIEPEQNTFLLTESPPGPKANREKLTQIMFEVFNVQQFCIKNTPCLCLYSAGKLTGMAVETGSSTTWIAPIYEGYLLPHACLRHHTAGSRITLNLYNKIEDKCPSNIRNLGRVGIFELTNDIKEKCCYVSQDYVNDIGSLTSNSINYTLPDGTNLTVDEERFTCTEEILMQTGTSFSESIYNSIMKSDIDIRNILYSNIVIGGGNSLFKGLPERVHSDLFKIAPRQYMLKVQRSKNARYSVWIGGSIFASLQNFNQKCVTLYDYDECGPSIVHRRCF